MLNPELKLTFGQEGAVAQSTREGFGAGIVEAAELNPDVVVVCADLTESLRLNKFKERFSERFIQIGVSEQLLNSLGAGLAMGGKVPFLASFAMFSPGRAWEQVRTNICLNDTNVKIVGGHAGVTVGPDGATHQALEDIAIMRCIPNMTVVVPCDGEQARLATLAAAKFDGPIYLRLGRDKTPAVTSKDTPFEIGQAQLLRDGKDAVVMACGIMVAPALNAAEELVAEGIECSVVNVHTVKPLDETAIVAAAKKIGAVVTAEEHQIAGGMGSAIAELLAATHPVPMEFIGVRDQFGQSGESAELLAHYGLDKESIKAAVRRAVARK